ncbi:TPA: hypothetical protein N2Q78_004578 [Citrobacter freundii]|nr:hypothetical protein [Citrobacter freundii]
MKKWLRILLPHWETDTVVLQAEGNELHIVCSYADVESGELFDGMCELRIFTWFNWGFPVGEPVNVRSFEPKVNA